MTAKHAKPDPGRAVAPPRAKHEVMQPMNCRDMPGIQTLLDLQTPVSFGCCGLACFCSEPTTNLWYSNYPGKRPQTAREGAQEYCNIGGGGGDDDDDDHDDDHDDDGEVHEEDEGEDEDEDDDDDDGDDDDDDDDDDADGEVHDDCDGEVHDGYDDDDDDDADDGEVHDDCDGEVHDDYDDDDADDDDDDDDDGDDDDAFLNAFLCGGNHHFLWVSEVTLGSFRLLFGAFSVLHCHGVSPSRNCFFECFLVRRKSSFSVGFRSDVRQFLAAFWCLLRPSLPWCLPVREVLF